MFVVFNPVFGVPNPVFGVPTKHPFYENIMLFGEDTKQGRQAKHPFYENIILFGEYIKQGRQAIGKVVQLNKGIKRQEFSSIRFCISCLGML